MAEIYSNAARIIDRVLQKKGTPKTLVIENRRVKNKKKLYALVCEALKYKSVTDKLLEDTKLLLLEKQLNYPMGLVLIYDYLFGHGLQLGGQLKQVINRNKTGLQAALARMKVKAKVVNNADLLPQNIQEKQDTPIPRYVRVNTLKTSTDDVITWFTENGFQLMRDTNTSETLQIAKQTFSVDKHIPNVLVFSPGTDLHNNTLYEEGKIVLQDKASSFPAFVLDPPRGSLVIDACAAPGNKTSHLAAIMENAGIRMTKKPKYRIPQKAVTRFEMGDLHTKLRRKIYAFDISEKRISTMKKLLQRAGEKIVEAKHKDFLKVDPTNPVYKNVQYILVDPSCSGSGIIHRLDYVTSANDNMDKKEKQRVYSLSQFQIKVLSHALRFPSVKKVVYSTCSLHTMENEEVVKKVLETFHEKFDLSVALPEWPYRGHPLFSEASKCVRASPKEGATSGFFLALFVARKSEEIFSIEDDQQGLRIENETVTGFRKKRRLSGASTVETPLDQTLRGRRKDCVNMRNKTDQTKRRRKRHRTTDNVEIREEPVEKKLKTFKYRRTDIKGLKLHRKCYEKEFENKLRILKKRKRKKGML